MISTTFISGLITGAMNKFITHPIDTIKARIQINQIEYQSLKNIKKIGIINTTKRIYQKEGFRGFYKGVGIACIFGAPASCLFFGSYESLKYEFNKNGYL